MKRRVHECDECEGKVYPSGLKRNVFGKDLCVSCYLKKSKERAT